MSELTKDKTRKLLILCRDFIINDVLTEDRKAQREIHDLFEQIINLLD